MPNVKFTSLIQSTTCYHSNSLKRTLRVSELQDIQKKINRHSRIFLPSLSKGRKLSEISLDESLEISDKIIRPKIYELFFWYDVLEPEEWMIALSCPENTGLRASS